MVKKFYTNAEIVVEDDNIINEIHKQAHTLPNKESLDRRKSAVELLRKMRED